MIKKPCLRTTAVASFIITCVLILVTAFGSSTDYEEQRIINEYSSQEIVPTSIELYHIIERKSEEYGIPKHIAYNVVYMETRYRGPFHWNYNPYLTSSAGAQGPMQIITRYAHHFVGRTVTPTELRTDLEMNVDVSMKMLKKLYRMYGQWDLVLGYYNTGYPQVNDYARYGSSTRNYKEKWLKLKTQSY
jgi:soluble lytic murein transglycosylase-like protein